MDRRPRPVVTTSASGRSSLDELRSEARSLRQSRRFDRALSLLSRVILSGEGTAADLSARAICHRELGDYRASVADLSKAILVSPSDPDLFCSRALSWYCIEDHTRGIEDASRAVSLNPKFADAFDTRGLFYLETQQYDLAAQDFAEAIRLSGDEGATPSKHYNCGVAYYRMRKYDLALVQFSRTIELNPKDVDSYAYRGTVYFYLGSFAEAIPDLSLLIVSSAERQKKQGGGSGGGSGGGGSDGGRDSQELQHEQQQQRLHFWRRGFCYCFVGNFSKARMDFGRAFGCFASSKRRKVGQQFRWVVRDLERMPQIGEDLAQKYLPRLVGLGAETDDETMAIRVLQEVVMTHQNRLKKAMMPGGEEEGELHEQQQQKQKQAAGAAAEEEESEGEIGRSDASSSSDTDDETDLASLVEEYRQRMDALTRIGKQREQKIARLRRELASRRHGGLDTSNRIGAFLATLDSEACDSISLIRKYSAPDIAINTSSCIDYGDSLLRFCSSQHFKYRWAGADFDSCEPTRLGDDGKAYEYDEIIVVDLQNGEEKDEDLHAFVDSVRQQGDGSDDDDGGGDTVVVVDDAFVKDLVERSVAFFGGPVSPLVSDRCKEIAEESLAGSELHELRLGALKGAGLLRHRSFAFKLLCDATGVPCRLNRRKGDDPLVLVRVCNRLCVPNLFGGSRALTAYSSYVRHDLVCDRIAAGFGGRSTDGQRDLRRVLIGGSVSLVTFVDSELVFAVKEMTLRNGDDSDSLLEELQREVSLAQTFSHPNVVTPIGCFHQTRSVDETEEDVEYRSKFLLRSSKLRFPKESLAFCIVLPLYNLNGETALRYFLDELPSHFLRLQETLILLLSIVNGLRYLHEQAGILHQNLKPSNVLIRWTSSDGGRIDEVRLTDWRGLKPAATHAGIVIDEKKATSDDVLAFGALMQFYEELWGGFHRLHDLCDACVQKQAADRPSLLEVEAVLKAHLKTVAATKADL